MKILRSIGTAAIVAAIACSPAFAQSAVVSNQRDMQMNAASRQQLIDAVIKERSKHRYAISKSADSMTLLLVHSNCPKCCPMNCRLPLKTGTCA
jgi:hypothetical protein